MSRTHQEAAIFIGVQRAYEPSVDVVVRFQRGAHLLTTASSEDWIGLFRVGWTSTKELVASATAPKPSPNQVESRVTFVGSKTPTEDGRFYQFCYVTKEGAVRGASAPFQFTRSRREVAPKEAAIGPPPPRSDHEECETRLQEKDQIINNSRRTVTALEEQVKEKTSLLDETSSRLRSCSESNVQLQQRLEIEAEKNKRLIASILEGEERCQATLKQRDDLKIELERARTEKDELRAALDDQREHLNSIVARHQEELNALRDEGQARVAEIGTQARMLHEAEGQARKLEEKLMEREEELRVVRETMDETLERVDSEKRMCEEQLARAKEENATLKAALHTQTSELLSQKNRTQNLASEFATQQQELHTGQEHLKVLEEQLTQKGVELEREKQDHFVTQENFVELVGGSVACDTNVVERSAYEALQAAYEELDRHYQEAQKVCERGERGEAAARNHIQTLESQCDELKARVSQCKKEYEAKAKECLELRRSYAHRGACEPEVAAGYEARIKGLEQQVVKLEESHCALSKELDDREALCREQELKVRGLEDQLALSARELKEEQAKVLEARRGAARGSLEETSLSSITLSRVCPICSIEFSLGAPVREFEAHVNSHLHD